MQSTFIEQRIKCQQQGAIIEQYNGCIVHADEALYRQRDNSSIIQGGPKTRPFLEVYNSCIQCVQKKETKCFFCNIFYKTRTIPTKFFTQFIE